MSREEQDMSAIEHFIEVWSDGYLSADTATHMTCVEVEALAGVFRAFGHNDTADRWIADHAEADDCGDMHCRCDDPECIQERTKEA
ncbi:hypothetical protein KIP29_gp18 [Mycobacterium phage BabyRay]|uniref:Uncharacterized protein n=1 Tax=Mycobacterium phage BabyRay TaxID=1897486 RepID=A0A1D8EW50_9CAUD|nr:hypothetical protein KIP29_gp18 [Mycobacterium phage BabyRay]AOT25446.1 hypothetical protein SEA_BABYRAY_82 [Mycobacterium phage BabyRay]